MDMKARKLNRRFIIGSLSILSGLCLIGSVSSTISFFVASTRTSIGINGTTKANCSNNLLFADVPHADGTSSDVDQISIKEELRLMTKKKYQDEEKELDDEIKELEDSSLPEDKDALEKLKERMKIVQDYLKDLDGKTSYVFGSLSPVTNYVENASSASLTKDLPLGEFYSNPSYQYFDVEDWDRALPSHYLQYTLTLKMKEDVDVDQEVYLEDLSFLNTDETLRKMMRFHFSSEYVLDGKKEETNTLVSFSGTSTDCFGYLDLNKDGQLDKGKYTYDFDSENKDPVLYGKKDYVETSYSVEGVKPLSLNGVYQSGTGHALGVIPSGGSLKLTITTWLEGWEKDGTNTTIWDDTVKGMNYEVGMTFGVSYL